MGRQDPSAGGCMSEGGVGAISSARLEERAGGEGELTLISL